MKRTNEKQQNKAFDLINQMSKGNDGESIINAIQSKARQKQAKRGRPPKGETPVSETEIKCTISFNETDLQKLKEISHIERLQIKDVFGALLEMFISEYEKTNGEIKTN